MEPRMYVPKPAIYRAEEPHDPERPEFDCYMPATDMEECWMADCWICNEFGEVHPDYNVSPVPVHAGSICEKVGEINYD